ncbi:AraC-type DNA-binding domain-containing protein [Vibrio maritimus]|uniref:AraC-type DNA-binding domain-containing protein n=1 Tax=Vibrio maritimus TaxID=990268 RepID=A0A090T7C0_9VIBR|nr:AraC-type DNA-binding domain-containing protein [Vibrio maritimus]
MFRNVHFVRVMGIKGLVDRLQLTYGITSDALGIPRSVLEYDMNLIPVSVLNQFYEDLERITEDPDAVLTLVRQMDLSKLGSLSHWFFAGHDLATTIRRINSGITCIQSGAFLVEKSSGLSSNGLIETTRFRPTLKRRKVSVSPTSCSMYSSTT